MNRRAQPAITIRSRRAVDRLKLLTRNGRSQAQVIEEALERMPLPLDNAEFERRKATVLEAVERFNAEPGGFKSMAEYDAWEYDENGNPRQADEFDDNGNVRGR